MHEYIINLTPTKKPSQKLRTTLEAYCGGDTNFYFTNGNLYFDLKLFNGYLPELLINSKFERVIPQLLQNVSRH